MNIIDCILILILLLSIWSGWQKGFITGMFELLILAAGLLCAFFTYQYIAAFISKHWSSLGIWTIPVSFVFALILARIILSFIVNRMLQSIPDSAHVSLPNRAMGIVPGAVNGFIWATIVAALFLSIPFSDNISEKTRNSAMAGKLAEQIEWLDDKFSPVFDEAVNKTMNKLTVEPGSEKSVSLPFTETDPNVRIDLEAKMLVLVNEERLKAKLKPLKADPEMLVVARAHSADMFARGYFSHVTPEGNSPFDRMKKAKVRFMAGGENLALGQTLLICHRGLMNSPGHRANILNTRYGRVGIGILDGGIYGLMITQNFRN